MGEVYRARDTQLGRDVAIKLLRGDLDVSRERLSRFAQEARAASALNHPNIITVHEIGYQDESPYIVMELVDGTSLRDLIVNGPLPLRRAIEISCQIADGLAAAHEKGIVHRDLKPDNVMVSRDGFAKILDFGLAKLSVSPVEDEASTLQFEAPRTRAGVVFGTAAYMSPEQASGIAPDFRSDQFSLGVIFYEMVTSRRPFIGPTTVDTLAAILHSEPEPIEKLNPGVPAPFRWIIERCLEKEADERYASTRDLARELRTIRDRVFETGSGDLPRPSAGTDRRSLVQGAGIIAAVVVVASLLSHRAPTRSAAPPVSAAASLPQKKCLAVLAFKDLSGDPGGQLLVDGLSETLSVRLARLPDLQVMPPSSSSSLDQSRLDRVGQMLGANLILRGAVQRAGTRLRVSYSLVRPEQGILLAGDTIDASSSDLFSTQDLLTESVARALQLSAPVRPILPASSLVHSGGQDRYLQALGYLQRYESEASVDGAVKLLEQLAAERESAQVSAALGRAYLSKYRLTHDKSWMDKAARSCELAVAEDSKLPDVHVTLGELRIEGGRWEEAAAEFQQTIDQQPGNVEAILGLAQAYRLSGKAEDAERTFRRAIALRPNYWAPYNKLGALYLSRGRYDDAAGMFLRVTELTPDNVLGYNNLGAVYQQTGRYDEAIRVFTQSIDRKPTGQAYSNLGTCQYFIGDFPLAARSFERATALTPQNDLYWANLGDAYRWSPGQEAKAAAAFDRAIGLARSKLQLNDRDLPARARLSLSLAKRGRIAEGRNEIAKAMKSDPDDPNLLYKAAVMEILAGSETQAISWLERAVKKGYPTSLLQRDPELKRLERNNGFASLLKMRKS